MSEVPDTAELRGRWTWSRYYGFLFPMHAMTAAAFLASGHTLPGAASAAAAFCDLPLIPRRAS